MFKRPASERFIRVNKLGADYEKEGLENVFTRQIERKQEHERVISRNQGTQRTDEKLSQSSHERGNGERSHDTQSIESDSRKIGQSHEQHAINFEHARSEEHTSELQSRGHLVCRLLLEKKNKIKVHKRQNT